MLLTDNEIMAVYLGNKNSDISSWVVGISTEDNQQFEDKNVYPVLFAVLYFREMGDSCTPNMRVLSYIRKMIIMAHTALHDTTCPTHSFSFEVSWFHLIAGRMLTTVVIIS